MAIDLIPDLYRIEQEIQDLSHEERLQVGEERSKPRLQAFFAWLGMHEGRVLPKGPISEAMRYAWNQRQALERYLKDGPLSIGKNPAEGELRPFAVGQQNWLFFQRESGGKTAAVLISLLMTAKAQCGAPEEHLREVLTTSPTNWIRRSCHRRAGRSTSSSSARPAPTRSSTASSDGG